MGNAEDFARLVHSQRIGEIADQVRYRYSIPANEQEQKPAVSNVLLIEQLFVNAGLLPNRPWFPQQEEEE